MRAIRSTLLFGLVATLPLFSLRGATGGYSITLFFLLAIIATVPRRLPSLGTFELIHVVYLFAAGLSAAAFAEAGAVDALVKSTVYFCAFLALRETLRDYSRDELRRLFVPAAQAGTALYIGLATVAVVSAGMASSILSDLSYWGFGFRLQIALNQLVGGREGIEGSDAIRNTVGEAFALLAVLPLLLSRGKLTRVELAFVLLAALCVVATFSRRAALDVGLIVLGLGLVSGMSRRAWIGVTVVLGIVVALVFGVFGVDNRLANLSGGTRVEQYREAIYWLGQHPWTGVGFGAKLAGIRGEPIAVHNFVLSQGFMLGVGGVAFAALVVAIIFRQLVRSVGSGDRLGLLLVIPLVGMTVSSTLGGIYGPPAWIALALSMPKPRRRAASGFPQLRPNRL